jgi:hypothetical protein
MGPPRERETMSEKIRILCGCGKRYGVPAAKAGKRIRCKECGANHRVPGPHALAETERDSILRELGIDPDEAKRGYEAEKLRVSSADTQRIYHCVKCMTSLESSGELAGAYVKGDLLCAGCRDSGEVEQRTRAAEEKKDDDRRALVIATHKRDPVAALGHAVGHGALVFLGFFGPFSLILHWSYGRSFVVAGLIAVAAATTAFRMRV